MAKVRVSLSLDEEIIALLRELAEAGGMNVSAFVNQVFKHSLPQMKAVSDAHKLAVTDPIRASRLLLNASDDSFDQLEEITSKIKEKVKPRGQKRVG